MQITSTGSAVPSTQYQPDKAIVASPTYLAPAAAATTVSANPVSAASQAASANDVANAVKDLNKAMKAMSSELEFSLDPDSDQVIVRVMDQRTNEIIRQMPTKEALEIAKAMDKVQGMLIKQKA